MTPKRRKRSGPRPSVAARNRAAYDQEHLAAVGEYFRAAVALARAVVTKSDTPEQGSALAESIAAVKLARLNATRFAEK